MAGKTPPRAVANFLRPIRKAVACITKTALSVQCSDPSSVQVLLLGTGDPVELRSDTEKIAITMLMNYRVIPADGELGKWKVQTVGYYYNLLVNDEERLAYHFHPTTPRIWFPHIHIREPRTRKLHLPSGRISMEEFIRLLITEYGVKPTRDWESALIDTQKRFEKYRTWA